MKEMFLREGTRPCWFGGDSSLHPDPDSRELFPQKGPVSIVFSNSIPAFCRLADPIWCFLRSRFRWGLRGVSFLNVFLVFLLFGCGTIGNNLTTVPAEWLVSAIRGNFASIKDLDASGYLKLTKDRKLYDLRLRLRVVVPSVVRLDLVYGGAMGVVGGKTMSLLIQGDRYLGYVPDENMYFRGDTGSGDLGEVALDGEALFALFLGETLADSDNKRIAFRKGGTYTLIWKSRKGTKTVLTVDGDFFVPTRVEVYDSDGSLLTVGKAEKFRRHGGSWIASYVELWSKPGEDKLSMKLQFKSFDTGLEPSELELRIPDNAVEGVIEL